MQIQLFTGQHLLYMEHINRKDYDDLHHRYSTLRDDHAAGRITKEVYTAAFEQIMISFLELLNWYGRTIDNFIMGCMDIQTMKGGQARYYDFMVNRYIYLQKNYAIMKAVFEQTIVVYGTGKSTDDTPQPR